MVQIVVDSLIIVFVGLHRAGVKTDVTGLKHHCIVFALSFTTAVTVISLDAVTQLGRL